MPAPLLHGNVVTVTVLEYRALIRPLGRQAGILRSAGGFEQALSPLALRLLQFTLATIVLRNLLSC